MLSNDIKKYIGELSGASARHFANAKRAEESRDGDLAARLKVEGHVLLAVAVKLDQILSFYEPNSAPQPQLDKAHVSGSLPPFGFEPLFNQLRERIYDSKDFTDAEAYSLLSALNEVSTAVLKVQMRRQISR